MASDPSVPHGVARPVILQGASEQGFAVAYVLPVRTMRDHPLDRALFDANAIVVVRRGKRSEPLDPALVRDLLDITLGEARVAALVGAGIAPKDAAARLGIAEQTVRTVLKRGFLQDRHLPAERSRRAPDPAGAAVIGGIDAACSCVAGYSTYS